MDLATDMMTFLINAPIVETIVGNLFFHDNEQLHEFDDKESDNNVAEAIAKKGAMKEGKCHEVICPE
jgi:hypothetical protein